MSGHFKPKSIFHGSKVSWFSVPSSLVGTKTSEPVMAKLSNPALRLYLAILSTAGRDSTSIVIMSTEHIERAASITKTNIKRYREELRRRRLISFEKVNGHYVYQILNPDAGGALPSSLPKTNAGELKPYQVEQVFVHFIGDQRLTNDDNGLRFICPFHERHGSVDGKRKHLSVKLSAQAVWQCTYSKCKHHGARREETITDDSGRMTNRVVVGGGGDVLDFVAAMTQLNDDKQISRPEAQTIMTQVLKAKSSVKVITQITV